MTGELNVMDHSGDTKLIWDSEKRDEVDAAREMFEKLQKKGYLAFTVKGKDGDKGEVIRKFDPNQERIIMAPPIAGG